MAAINLVTDGFFDALSKMHSRPSRPSALIDAIYRHFSDLLLAINTELTSKYEHYYDVHEVFQYNIAISEIYPLYLQSCSSNVAPMSLLELQINFDSVDKLSRLLRKFASKYKQSSQGKSETMFITPISEQISDLLYRIKCRVKQLCCTIQIRAHACPETLRNVSSLFEKICSPPDTLCFSDIEAVQDYACSAFNKIINSKCMDYKYPEFDRIVEYLKVQIRAPNIGAQCRANLKYCLPICDERFNGDLKQPIKFFKSFCEETDLVELRKYYISEISSQIHLVMIKIADSNIPQQNKNELNTLLDTVLIILCEVSAELIHNKSFNKFKTQATIEGIQVYKAKANTFYPHILDDISRNLNKLLSDGFCGYDLMLNNITKHLERLCFYNSMKNFILGKCIPTQTQIITLTLNLLMLGMKLHFDVDMGDYRSIVSKMDYYDGFSQTKLNKLISELVHNEAFIFGILCGKREQKNIAVLTPSKDNYAVRRSNSYLLT